MAALAPTRAHLYIRIEGSDVMTEIGEVDIDLTIVDVEPPPGANVVLRADTTKLSDILRAVADNIQTSKPSNAPKNHHHQVVQHRDGKPPWCNTCGLTAAGTIPSSRFERRDGTR